MKDLFDTIKEENIWQEHYKNMPEYNNIKEDKPLITVTFKFRSQEDFDNFNKLVKEHLYSGEKVFDGMQKKDVKTAWYPANKKASKYKYL